MTHRLTTNCAKNYCNRTLIVKVIVENVVTCFLGDTVYRVVHTVFTATDGTRDWLTLPMRKHHREAALLFDRLAVVLQQVNALAFLNMPLIMIGQVL